MAEVEERAGKAHEAWELTVPELGFFALVWSDYRAHLTRPESRARALLRYLPRLLLNPSLQLAFLVRLAQRGPAVIAFPVRWLQVVLFSSEIYWFRGSDAIRIGPGVDFPHPVGIVIGPGTQIGTRVTIYNHATIGSDRHWTTNRRNERVPRIGDRAVIYSHSSVQGPVCIGHDGVVGAQVVLEEDVPPGALRTRNRLRLRGEWRNEGR